MAFKTFTSAVFTSSDVQTYLMNQAVVTCTSNTRPSIPPVGMIIYQTDTDDYYFCSNATGPVWSLLTTRLKYRTATADTTLTDTTLIKDGGCGDIAFTSPGTSVPFRLRYWCHPFSDTDGTQVAINLIDGGTSSPTSSGTVVAVSSFWVALASTIQLTQVVCDTIGTFSAGTHTVAAFYGRGGVGTGNVNVRAGTSAGPRILSVEMLT